MTLHVGIGTFRPIEADRIEDHVLHAEWAEVTAADGGRVESTTRARAGGSWPSGPPRRGRWRPRREGGRFAAFSGETALYLKPGHAFRGLDALITNFHLPRSSLLVLVSALAGVEFIRAAYAEAIREAYRFYSYGDAMLVLPGG